MTSFQTSVLMAVTAGLLLVPLVGSNYTLRLITTALMYATLAMAWNFIGGFGGYPLFGLAAFFGLGAYAGAILQSVGIPIAVAWLLAVLVNGLFAAFLGLILLRLQGHAFAIATLVVGEALRELTTGWTNLTGGGMGLNLPFAALDPSALSRFFFYACLP